MSNTKHIVIAAEIFPPDIGGPATYARKLAEVLAEEGYAVTVVTYGDPKTRLRITNYELRITNRKISLPFRYFVYAWKLFWAARNADVVYAQGPLSAGFPSMLVKRVLGVRLVVKVVGDQAWERARQTGKTQLLLDDFQKQKTTGKIQSIQRIQKDVLAVADHVITVSNWFKGVIAGWGIDEEKVSVIHNAVTPSNSPLDKGESVIEGDVILSVGRLTEWKGFGILIAIMPELLKVNPDFKLVIVGEGPEEKELRNKIKDLELRDSVLMVGRKSKEELAGYYNSAKMFVLNSGYENWSHVTIEAMHAGLPIVISNVGGNPETVQKGELGVLVEYNNAQEIQQAIIDLWNNPQKREELGTKARAYAESYSVDDMIEQTKKVLFK